ncbi:hypothetical protein TEPIDINF_000214 [Tepidibacillus infernus]|uniref:hypothetical protein n=1 Tax=Tepidibacillus infernus TaxID=1806172 RepID=UPI003B6D2F93
MEKPYHSIFLFVSEIDEDRIHHIFQYIKQGIKIYLFTFVSLENYESNEKWKYLRKKGLFGWRKVPYHSEYEMDGLKQLLRCIKTV